MIAPVFLDQAVHPDGGDLVDDDEHRLAALPGRGVVRDEVPGGGVEALGCGDDVVVAFQLGVGLELRDSEGLMGFAEAAGGWR